MVTDVAVHLGTAACRRAALDMVSSIDSDYTHLYGSGEQVTPIR